ncbi:hypothetical protein TNCV_1340691 [Trichonephila clavipes]|nr:hypothetical protein TNCV_1340691 [Trichonephila clavipes]
MSSLRPLVQRSRENILLKCCTTTGIRNYDQQLSGMPDSSAHNVMEDSWHVMYRPANYRYSTVEFFN